MISVPASEEEQHAATLAGRDVAGTRPALNFPRPVCLGLASHHQRGGRAAGAPREGAWAWRPPENRRPTVTLPGPWTCWYGGKFYAARTMALNWPSRVPSPGDAPARRGPVVRAETRYRVAGNQNEAVNLPASQHMNNNSNPIVVSTHNGVFHADDAMAIAIIRLAHPGSREVRVVRTRDPFVLATCEYVIDVGGEYDPSRGRFDHHQPGGAGAREGGAPYASAGLLWSHLHEEVVCRVEADASIERGAGVRPPIREIAARVDNDLISPIDAADCGVGKPAEAAMARLVGRMNPAWDESPQDYDTAFMRAVALCEAVLRCEILGVPMVSHLSSAAYAAMDEAEAKGRARGEVEMSFVRRDMQEEDPRVLLLPRFAPWQDHLAKAEGDAGLEGTTLYVVFPAPGNTQWNVQAVPGDEGPFSKRKALPEEWAGLQAESLAAATGVADAVFCHNGRFIAGAKSQEGALALARLAVEA